MKLCIKFNYILISKTVKLGILCVITFPALILIIVVFYDLRHSASIYPLLSYFHIMHVKFLW